MHLSTDGNTFPGHSREIHQKRAMPADISSLLLRQISCILRARPVRYCSCEQKSGTGNPVPLH